MFSILCSENVFILTYGQKSLIYKDGYGAQFGQITLVFMIRNIYVCGYWFSR